MATRIKLRRDTTQNWTTVNPILANGEMGIEADTRRAKLGDGATHWNDLKYAFTDQLRVDGKTVNSEMGVSIASQDPETWISTVRARGNWAGTDGVAYDSMGNLYLSGWEEYGYNDLDYGSGKAFLTKFDSKGQILWSKYTNLTGYSIGGGVVVDSADNVSVITADWDNGFFAITQYTEDGEQVWQKTYNDSYDYAGGFSLAVDSNDDIVVVGFRVDDAHGDATALFAMKIDGADGSITWTKNMGSDYRSPRQPSLAVDGDNNVIVAVWDTENDNGHVNVVKLDSAGVFVWSKVVQNPENEWDGYELSLGSLDADELGNIYFVGSYVVPHYVTNLNGDTGDGRAGLILKMNSDAVVQWSRIVGPGDCFDMGAQIVYKAGRLYATFQTERPYYKNDVYRNGNIGYTTQEIVLACYDTANGKVLWQNNFGPEILWGYSNPTGSPENVQDDSPMNYAGRMIAVYKDYVAMAGQAGEYSRADDNETRSYGFVAQLPADGTEMDLDGWIYKTSKHRGLYAKVRTYDYSDYVVSNITNITATNGAWSSQDTADNVRIDLLAAGANQWDFKPNGDLALPVGGNIELSRPTQGSINVVGYFDSDNEDNIGNFFNSVTTDADGNQYYVGGWNWHDNSTNNGDSSLPLVVKVNAQGQIEWKSRLSNYNLYESDAVLGSANAVAYDPSSGRIVVVCNDSGEGTADQMLIVDIDPVNGDVVESHRFAGPDDVIANGIAINTQGERFITGTIQGDNAFYFTITNTMAVVGHNDTAMVPRTVFAGHEGPSWKNGTNGWGLAGASGYVEHNLNAIDYYENVSGTTRNGSGATFTVEYNSGSYAVTVISAGIHYLPGHEIKVLGSLLGGVDGDNDLIITVDSLLDPNIGDIDAVTASGTASETGSFPYTPVTGSNINTGTGFTISVQVNANTTTNNLTVYHYDGGSSYVVNDVITFPGTSFGGTSTATDVVIKALQVGGYTGDVQSGEGSGYTVIQRGVSPLTYARLQFSGADFTSGGPDYRLKHNTDANTFLAKFVSTATTSTSLVWAKWIEKSNYDKGVAVDYDSDGNLYWASMVVDDGVVGSGDNFLYRPTVTKLSSTGTALWSKTFGIDGNEGYTIGLQVDSEDYVVLGFQVYRNFIWDYYDPVIRRITGDGDALWTKSYLGMYGAEGNGGGLALDSDDNIYVTIDNYDGEDQASWAVKLDIQRGREIWQQETSHERQYINHGFYESNAIATDGKKYYVGKWTMDIDGNEGNALAVALPADGSADNTEHGPFAVHQAYYTTEGGTGDGGYDSPVFRNYNVTTATLTEVFHGNGLGNPNINRFKIQAWIEPGPSSNYPVITKSDSGIVFGDGSVQNTSGQGIPQISHKRQNKFIRLKASDAGKHLYVQNTDNVITVPTYSEVQFPVGTVITVVNISGGYVYIAADKDNYRTQLYCPALDGHEGAEYNINGIKFEDNGGGCLITLLKVEESYSNGSRWVVTGNNSSFFDNYNP
jgi:hypothetical protein